MLGVPAGAAGAGPLPCPGARVRAGRPAGHAGRGGGGAQPPLRPAAQSGRLFSLPSQPRCSCANFPEYSSQFPRPGASALWGAWAPCPQRPNPPEHLRRPDGAGQRPRDRGAPVTPGPSRPWPPARPTAASEAGSPGRPVPAKPAPWGPSLRPERLPGSGSDPPVGGSPAEAVWRGASRALRAELQ